MTWGVWRVVDGIGAGDFGVVLCLVRCWFWDPWSRRWRCRRELCTQSHSGETGCFLDGCYCLACRLSNNFTSDLFKVADHQGRRPTRVSIEFRPLTAVGRREMGRVAAWMWSHPRRQDRLPVSRVPSLEPVSSVGQCGPTTFVLNCHAWAGFHCLPHATSKATRRDERTTGEI